MGKLGLFDRKLLKLDNLADGHEFLVLEKDICKWLKRMGITKYNLVADMQGNLLVDVFTSVDLMDKGLKFIPVRFNKISGGFNCSQNTLITLKGSPVEVSKGFYCYGNILTDLVGAPPKIGLDFFCSNNLLTSLKGSPKDVPGDFECGHNSLTTLEHCPQTVGINFSCEDNSLTTFDFLPEKVGAGFWYHNNDDIINYYEGIEDNLTFADIKRIALIKKEKLLLDGSITGHNLAGDTEIKSVHKI